jgi:glycosyltransferase involved in cell wall biosynthesis
MSEPAQATSTLRVLMTVDSVGGVWQYALDAAIGMRPYGVETILVVLGPQPSDDQMIRAENAGLAVINTGLPLDWTADDPADVEKAGRAIAHLAAKIQPDIVHLNSPALAARAEFPCPVVAVCHSCVATWWEAVCGGALPEEFVWRTELMREGYHAADRLLAPTAAFADATTRVYDLAVPPAVIRNGRGPILGKESAKQELFAFTAGRLWDDGKNFAALERAAPRFSLPLFAAGPLEGPNGTRVAALHATALGRLSDNEIAERLSAQPIFVSVAKYEPFGLAVLEAAQAGCPLVLSGISTFHELWDGVALFVNPDDDQAIADSVNRLASDAAVRREMGEAARKRAKAYSLEAMSMGLLSVYQSLLPSMPNLFSLKGAAA